jgi:hypothetical protein
LGLLTNTGRSLFQFALGLYIAATIIGNMLLADGYTLPAPIARAMTIFNLTGFILGGTAAAKLLAPVMGGVFRDTLGKASGTVLYVTALAAGATGLIGVLEMIVGMLPFADPAVRQSLVLFLGGPALFMMGYYVMYQLGYVPDE